MKKKKEKKPMRRSEEIIKEKAASVLPPSIDSRVGDPIMKHSYLCREGQETGAKGKEEKSERERE